MNFSTLSNAELERWLYASPNDLAAREEMLKRTCSVQGADDDLTEAEDQITSLESELEDAQAEIRRGEEHLAARDQEVDNLRKQITDAGIDLL